MAKFKARARALDMLGRQQIAGIPNAVSELFKNAHDAYADNVEVDYIRPLNLFVLRDDGLGMTREEFETRWLTIGTESKFINKKSSPPPVDATKEKRPVMGEKGIGRLAIASIGPQVMVLTRAKRDDGLHDLVVSLINWKLFEIPGVDLEDLHIALETFKGGTLPTQLDLQVMVNEIADNIEYLLEEDFIDKSEFDELIEQNDKFLIDLQSITSFLNKPTLLKDGYGTHFFITPTDEMLDVIIEEKKDSVSQLQKALLGFTNTMIPGAYQAPVKTAFRVHNNNREYNDLIGGDSFWTHKEYAQCDHHISGTFDEFGQFKGSVNVYGENQVNNYVVPWVEGRGAPTQCGAFSINIAYSQGKFSDSRLDDKTEYSNLSKKLDRIAGVYLYKDGIRILPYGDSDFDWLEIEKNRTKSASYYFFSYRRMFGNVDISSKNEKLVEKAGREGFRENKAYKQFRDLIKNFLLQVVTDFFRDPEKWDSQAGNYGHLFGEKKKELQRLDKARKKREKLISVRKKAFQDELNSVLERIEKNNQTQEINEFFSNAQQSLENIIAIKDADLCSVEFIKCEYVIREEFTKIQQLYNLQKPRGLSLSKEAQYDWDAYNLEYDNLCTILFNPKKKEVENLINEYAEKIITVIDRRKRLELSITTKIDEFKKSTRKDKKETDETLKKVSSDIVNLSRRLVTEYEEVVKNIQVELSHIEPNKLNDENLVEKRLEMENRLVDEAEKMKNIFENVRVQLDSVVLDDSVTAADITEAMETELVGLREKTDADLELSQLGLAVGVIQHEFGHTIRSIRDHIRALKAWADVNPKLNTIYSRISNNFEHLDGYLTLFTPLNRRLNRKAAPITGNDIHEFILEVFCDRIAKERHAISIEKTKAFSGFSFIGYPSTFYPVFLNIIDNAIFWLKRLNIQRRIVIDTDGTKIFISNNGESLPLRDKERIFELGYTRKPAGRGMGLNISRDVLHKVGYDIYVDEPQPDMNVTFTIAQVKNEGE